MTKFKVKGIVVVAGLSSRMGEFKPLLQIGYKTIIESTISSLKESGIEEIIVVVGYRGDEIKKVIEGEGIYIVYNNNYENSDMFQSIKIGIRSLNDCDAFFVVPGDMPLISAKTYEELKDNMINTKLKVVLPTINNRAKHPPLINKACIEKICKYHGENGLRGALSEFIDSTSYVAVEDDGCGMDVDTPYDYSRILKLIQR